MAISIMDLELRRKRAAAAFGTSNDIILIGAGMPISVPGGADQTFQFQPHPEYFWLTGRHREGGVLAFERNGGWTLFEPALSESEQVWGGSESPIGRPVTELDEWLKERSGRAVKWLGVPKDAEADKDLREAITHARRPKDASEIALMQRAATATAVGHAAGRAKIKIGATEREVQIDIESAMYHAGADRTGYGTIVGSGPNSTVLHSEPGTRKFQDGDVIVIDAGGAVDGYTADVTRTYPANGKFDADQQFIYDAVLRAQIETIEACKVGAEWTDIHGLSARLMAESLIEYGVIKCSVDEALETEVISMFFPHGIGHMVGLGVRDAGGPLPGREKKKVAGITLRMDIPLEAGYIVTVEPGLYFNRVLLRSEERRAKFKDAVDWARIEPWIGKLGVRIEDNILVTSDGPVNLTKAIPK
ncbi:MAG: aminopeptidase P family protein [Bacteroidota bacterium]|nr:aminopeptidase P family protein [Bacteroidota bacterium]MDP4234780.1 aminopeptidase P family protein [Bacteroidota bacterium]MDP4244140.1 aminopeptidase P family protein [Bacteroidota bacterium]MDP4289304.1 aminopeptidase P family protein [Bacteroidota bacterium]